MADNVVLAGATGNLGGRIARALSNRKANVVALTRSGTSDQTKRKALESLGVKVRTSIYVSSTRQESLVDFK